VLPSPEEGSGGEEREEEDDMTGGDSSGTIWQRGRSRLPDRPIPVSLRQLIKPSGKQ
jgi:hypothetical protein